MKIIIPILFLVLLMSNNIHADEAKQNNTIDLPEADKKQGDNLNSPTKSIDPKSISNDTALGLDKNSIGTLKDSGTNLGINKSGAHELGGVKNLDNAGGNPDGVGITRGDTGSGHAGGNKNGIGINRGSTGSGHTGGNKNGIGINRGSTGSGHAGGNKNGIGINRGDTGSGHAGGSKNGIGINRGNTGGDHAGGNIINTRDLVSGKGGDGVKGGSKVKPDRGDKPTGGKSGGGGKGKSISNINSSASSLGTGEGSRDGNSTFTTPSRDGSTSPGRRIGTGRIGIDGGTGKGPGVIDPIGQPGLDEIPGGSF